MPDALTLLSTLSTPRQATGSQAPTVSTISPTPDPSKHSAVCCCTLCEQRGTGELAMRSVSGDYHRFLVRVGSLPSSLLFRSGWRNAASSLLVVLALLPPRRGA